MQAPYQQMLILVAAGFDEQLVTHWTVSRHQLGLAVTLVGLAAGTARDRHGLRLKVDRTLETLPPERAVLVLLPGESGYVYQVLQDPRVHRLLREVVAAGGTLYTCAPRLLEGVDLPVQPAQALAMADEQENS